MEPAVLETFFGLPRVWFAFITAIIGLLFWIVGLLVLNFLYEHYLKDADNATQ